MTEKTTQQPVKTDKKKVSAKKVFKNIVEARLVVNATFNNTLVSVSDMQGGVIAWSSAGHAGFKGSRKSTPFAATVAIEKVLGEAQKHGVKKLHIFVKGPGTGRDAILRYLRAKRDFEVESLSDITPIAHNGPRAPKMRKM